MNKKYYKKFVPYIIPGFLGLAVFFIIPFVISIVLSFRANGSFGILNYQTVLHAKAFQLALKNTLRFIGVGIPVLLVCGGFLAIGFQTCIQNNLPGFRLLFSLHMLPMILPSAVIVFFIQLFLLHTNSTWVFYLMLGIYLWKNAPYVLLAFFSGLRNIPDEIYQAAQVDGANGKQTLWYITMPLLKPYTLIGVILAVLGVFRIFRESYLLFGNYPDQSIYFLQNYLNNLFYSFGYGQLAASSNLFLIGLTILFLVILSALGKEAQQ